MSQEKLFIVVLKYVVESEVIAANRDNHLKYLDEYYAKGVFIASGRQNPKYGGVIIAKAPSRTKLYEILSKDPYHQNLCAEYQAIEFEPNKSTHGFETCLNEVGLKLFSVK